MRDPKNYSACWGCFRAEQAWCDGDMRASIVLSNTGIIVDREYWFWMWVSTCPIHRFVHDRDLALMIDWNLLRWIKRDGS